ncbi:MAG: type II toxin-antitoxin system RelE/ParE family toxin [Acidimicrobiia bacterium]
MYEIYLEQTAERDFKKLPVETFHRIIPRIRALAETPRPPGCRKLAGSNNDWRIRVGDYRVIYAINDTEMTVRIFRVRHRR